MKTLQMHFLSYEHTKLHFLQNTQSQLADAYASATPVGYPMGNPRQNPCICICVSKCCRSSGILSMPCWIISPAWTTLWKVEIHPRDQIFQIHFPGIIMTWIECIGFATTNKKVMHLPDCSLRPSDWARRVDTDRQKWTRFDSEGSIGGI